MTGSSSVNLCPLDGTGKVEVGQRGGRFGQNRCNLFGEHGKSGTSSVRTDSPQSLKTKNSPAACAPNSWVVHFGELLEEKGFPSERIFRRNGIDPDLLVQGESGASLAQFAALVGDGLRTTGDSGLGLEYGLRGRISHFGILGYALLSARNLRHAIEFVSRYYETFHPVISFKFEVAPPQICARVLESAPLGHLEVFAHEAALACTAAVANFLLDEPISPTRLTLCYAEPPHSQRYATVFDCHPEFDAPYTSIRFESRHLNAPFKFANDEMAEICRQQCESRLWMIKERGGLVSKVRAELLQTPGQFPKMSAVAADLGMSVRSLRRYLSESGVTYQELLDQVRRDLAMDYLRNSPLSVEQVAQLVGYGEAASFRKAFRKWTGEAPGEFRN